MRVFIVIVLLVAVGIGITGFVRGWFGFSTSPDEENTNVTFKVDNEKWKKDRDAVLGVFHTSRDTFQKQAETRLDGMDKALDELKVKAKTAAAETKAPMDQAIVELGKQSQAARSELKELGAATPETYEALKTRLNVAMEDLRVGLEKAAARF